MAKCAVLILVGAVYCSAVSECQEYMATTAAKQYADYCQERCALWGEGAQSVHCPTEAQTSASALIKCVKGLEQGACGTTDDEDDSDGTTQAPTTTEAPTTTKTSASTTGAKETTAATTGVKSRATTTSTTAAATRTSTAAATTAAAATRTSTAAATTAAATTVVDTTSIAATTNDETESTKGVNEGDSTDYVYGGAGDEPEYPVEGGRGDNCECMYGYDEERDYVKGQYADVDGAVYQASTWCGAGSVPGSADCWKYLETCVGGSPGKLTDKEAIALADPDVPTLVYDPYNGLFPSKSEIREIEQTAISEGGTMMQEMVRAAKVLAAEEVEEITPGSEANPENVKRVESMMSASTFDRMFPFRHIAYSYENFLKAVGAFPSFCRTYDDGRDSDSICRRLLATACAHFAQETGANAPAWTIDSLDQDHQNPGAAEWYPSGTAVPTYFQGLYFVREVGYTEDSTTSPYEACEVTEANALVGAFYPCGTGKTYFGRGPFQLSWNYNYGKFSEAMYGDATVLLNDPSPVADTWLNFASGIWFAVTPQSPKPAMTWVVDGTWTPTAEEEAKGYTAGFGATINIINGGLECNSGTTQATAANRIKAYKAYMEFLGEEVSDDDETLDCANMPAFTAETSAAVQQYWNRLWTSGSVACGVSANETPFLVVRQGDYAACVDYFFRSKLVYRGSVVVSND